MGPISVSGYTLTNPPEASVKIEQLKPLIITVSIAKNRDGTWSSYSTSSDDNINVSVRLAGVNTKILSQTWKQKIWLNTGINLLGDKSSYVGMSYKFDRFSFGVHCGTDKNCGIDLGFRVFK